MNLKNVAEIYPLSPMQQGMLFQTIMAPQSGIYCQQFIMTLRPPLDVATVQAAWQQVIAHHAILRTAFVWEGMEQPLQVVREHVTLPWHEEDWQELAPDAADARLEQFLHDDRERNFTLSQAPLMRFTLLRLPDARVVLVWSLHHLLMDGASHGIVIHDFLAAYQALRLGMTPTLPATRPYRDYIAWLQEQDLSGAEVFWRNQLAGFTVATPLLTEQSVVSAHVDDTASEYEMRIGVDLSSALQTFARQNQLTLNTVLQGAWALVLQRYSGEHDVLFGITTSVRPPELPGAEAMVGIFINTLPLRLHVNPEERVLPWLHMVQTAQIETRQYDFSPLIDVQGWSDVPRGQPLFMSLLVFENYISNAMAADAPDMPISDMHWGAEQASFPITLTVAPGDEVVLRFNYAARRFDQATIARLAGHVRHLLAGLIALADQRLKDIALITPDERQQLLVAWNATQRDYPRDQRIHEVFDRQVAQHPTAIAARFRDQELTYAQLQQRANQVAHWLQARGVGPDVLVGLCVERSLEMVVGILGILKAGGAYVPLDPDYPSERLAFMLADSGVSLLLTQQRLVTRLPMHAAATMCLDTDWEAVAAMPSTVPSVSVAPHDLAYVIYTSGSTGAPKGVMVTHANISNHMYWMAEQYPLTATDRVLQKTPFSFDASVWEFYAPLLAGAQLVLLEPGAHQDIPKLVQTLASEQITILQVVPSLLRVLVDTAEFAACQHLRRVFCGGEALTVALQQAFFAYMPAAQLINLYGPTEATIEAITWICQPDEHSSVPIGRPIANAQAYVLDEQLQPQPVGVAGELYIGGAGVARGYLGRPDLTAERFIADPFNETRDARLYKTGDIVSYRASGELLYHGRDDQQVKIRGYRIELGEIEARLRQHATVRDGVVVAPVDSIGTQHLVAYVVAQDGAEVDGGDIRHFLGATLPNYMLPATVITLDALPMTPNGKIDRQALARRDPEQLRQQADYVAPRNHVEATVAAIWADVLGVDQVGVDDNFFELGGHSLSATQVTSRIREAYHTDFQIAMIFEYLTVAGVAQAIIQQELAAAAPDVVTAALEQRESSR